MKEHFQGFLVIWVMLTTFDFPVRLHVVKGIDVSTRLRLFSGSTEFIKPFVQATKQLEEIGVKAITSNCGFIVQYQDIISNSVNIPVFTSSLLQIPLVYKMLKKDQIIGILTADGFPILGKVKEVEGFIMAAGHEGDGIALSPITGELIAQLIVNGDTTFPLEEFRLERFMNNN